LQPKLDEALVAQFPLLYKPFGDKDDSCTMFGFECGDGWYRIIYDLSVQLHRIVEKLPTKKQPDFRAVQVKSKFGQLRWYSHSQTYAMTKLINEAEGLSVRTCEVCGEKGSQHNRCGWVETTCARHRRT
jgi:hypothetical protein